MIPDDLRLVIKCSITLNSDRYDAELAAIRALPQAIPFLQPDGDTERGSVCLCIPSIQEEPYPMDSILISTAIDVCRAYGINFIWGRKLFPTWQGNIKQGCSAANDVFNPAYWAVPIAQVTQEAHALGAVKTFLDCEPNGDHPAVKGWKTLGFDNMQREQVIAAIMSTQQQLGFRVNHCHPAGSSWNPKHPGYATSLVGQPFTHHTYRLRHPGEFKPNPPKCMTANMQLWSSWIDPDPQSVAGEKKPLTIEEFWNLPWDEIKTAWPELTGVVVYAGDHLAWALAELGKGD